MWIFVGTVLTFYNVLLYLSYTTITFYKFSMEIYIFMHPNDRPDLPVKICPDFLKMMPKQCAEWCPIGRGRRVMYLVLQSVHF